MAVMSDLERLRRLISERIDYQDYQAACADAMDMETSSRFCEAISKELTAILAAFDRGDEPKSDIPPRDPRCNCPLPYRHIVPEEHEEGCPVVAHLTDAKSEFQPDERCPSPGLCQVEERCQGECFGDAAMSDSRTNDGKTGD